MYYYNGAGVGAGDFNNDGWIDLSDKLIDYFETAKIINSLDLLITVCDTDI